MDTHWSLSMVGYRAASVRDSGMAVIEALGEGWGEGGADSLGLPSPRGSEKKGPVPPKEEGDEGAATSRRRSGGPPPGIAAASKAGLARVQS